MKKMLKKTRKIVKKYDILCKVKRKKKNLS